MSARAAARRPACRQPSPWSHGLEPRRRVVRGRREGRTWHAVPSKPMPRRPSQRELVERLYGPGGPRAGVGFRADLVARLWIVLLYLWRRGYGERDGRGSGRYACTLGELIDGGAPRMSRLQPRWRDRGSDKRNRHYRETSK